VTRIKGGLAIAGKINRIGKIVSAKTIAKTIAQNQSGPVNNFCHQIKKPGTLPRYAESPVCLFCTSNVATTGLWSEATPQFGVAGM
jgi:hypothetical protein